MYFERLRLLKSEVREPRCCSVRVRWEWRSETNFSRLRMFTNISPSDKSTMPVQCSRAYQLLDKSRILFNRSIQPLQSVFTRAICTQVGRTRLVKQSTLKQVRSVTCNLEVLLPKLQLCTGFGQRLTANFFSLFLQIFFVRFESMSSSRLSCLIYCDLYFWTYLFFLSSFQLLFINFLLPLLSLTPQNQNR